jgi:tape measure domain-containing protein
VAETAGRLDLIIGVDNSEALTGLERVKQSAINTGQGLKSAFVAFQGALAGTAIAATVKQISDLAIASESAGVRLSSLSGRFGESAQAVVVASNAAKQLNLSQTEAANGFAQLYSALRPTGVGLSDIETIFVGVTAAAKNSGLAAESVNNALIQLTQGLASGRLQGDELRSVLEQLPPLSQAIARELKVPVGAIKQLGSEGKITTDVIIRSLNSLKTIELAQLDKSLSTSAERIKALGVAWENLQLSLAQEFSGVGDGLLTGLKAALEFLGSVNLTETQQQIKAVEDQIATTTALIEESKKYKLDTTDAEERLRELERRMNNLRNRPDVVTTEREQLYAERLKILNDIQSQEKELFGQGATGVLLGGRDTSGRALLEGFDLAGAKALTALSGVEKEIKRLQSEKIALPFDANIQREKIDEQLGRLRSDLAKKRGGLIIDTQIEVSREALAELDRKLKQGSAEPTSPIERDQLRLQVERLLEARRLLNESVAGPVPPNPPQPPVDPAETLKAKQAGQDAIAQAQQQYAETLKLSKLKGDVRDVAAEQLRIDAALAAEAKAYVDAFNAQQGKDPINAQKLQDAATVGSINLNKAMVDGAATMKAALANAEQRFKAAGDAIKSALDAQDAARVSAFDVISDQAQQETRQRLINQVNEGISGGQLDPNKIRKVVGPDLGTLDIAQLADLAGKSASLLSAQDGIISANKELKEATTNLTGVTQLLAEKDWGVAVSVFADGTSQAYGDVVNRAI